LLDLFSIDSWRDSLRGSMRPLFVVIHHPPPRDIPHFFQGMEQVCAEHLLSVGFVEAFNKCILGGLAWLDVGKLHLMLFGPVDEPVSDKFGAIVQTDLLG